MSTSGWGCGTQASAVRGLGSGAGGNLQLRSGYSRAGMESMAVPAWISRIRQSGGATDPKA